VSRGAKMAKCVLCGKGGLFHKINAEGFCTDCERIRALEITEQELQCKIDTLKTEYKRRIDDTEAEYKRRTDTLETEYKRRIDTLESEYKHQMDLSLELESNHKRLYNEISEQAKADALNQIADTIKKKNSDLENIENNMEKQRKIYENALVEFDKLQKSISLNANKLLKSQNLIKSIQYSAYRYFYTEKAAMDLSDYKMNESIIKEADETLSPTVKLKFNLMDVRELRKRYNLNSKLIKELTDKYARRYTTKSNAALYKLMVIALEAELQNILYNLKYSKLDKAVKDIKLMTAKYQRLATDGNQNIANTVIKFIGEIEYLFIEAIKIEYEYYIQKERIKEEQRAIREKMRQEAKERKELELERKKIEQEEEKYKNEILSIQNMIGVTTDIKQKKQLEERIIRIQGQLTEVEAKKSDIIKLEHGQAGYIYIISNLGSFGEEVFKIGMTRRLDPQERIDELGDASVPFRFDVHSTIFSNNAPELENQIHKRLHNNRINKINLRKEFFKTSIDELENIVYSLEPSATFNRTMLAEQYHQSLAVEEVPESVEIIDDEEYVFEDETE
jgi:hypothetical protein